MCTKGNFVFGVVSAKDLKRKERLHGSYIVEGKLPIWNTFIV